jgi:uncharacterized membrane protein YfcA
MPLHQVVIIAVIGAGVGLLSGLFGKGGSAVATPLLVAVGIPPIVAVASPLPATIPTTVAAASAYWRERKVDWAVVKLTVLLGVPATVVGALLTRAVSADALVVATDLLLAGLGLRVLIGTDDPAIADTVEAPRARVAVIAVLVGFSSGLLANSGGALLAPLYLTVLHLPIKRTFATSLTAATALAVPATITHALLGHVDWAVVGVFALTSIPMALFGARFALKSNSKHLERAYGVVLVALGIGFAITRLI